MNSMIVTAISDVHVKSPHDDADRLLCRFLDHPKVQQAHYVFLLGDIFDLMAGNHPEYVKDYQHIFDKMDALFKKGVKVYFLEGNHDVNLEKLFKRIWKKGEIFPSQVPFKETIDGKKYYLSHGDEHEIDNIKYQRYIKFIRTEPLKFIANHIMPYSVLKFVGERASKKSRKKGHREFNEQAVKDTFRQGVTLTTKGEWDFVVGGHSHVKDEFPIPGNGTYVNNGYALGSKTFVLIENHQVSFPEI